MQHVLFCLLCIIIMFLFHSTTLLCLWGPIAMVWLSTQKKEASLVSSGIVRYRKKHMLLKGALIQYGAPASGH